MPFTVNSSGTAFVDPNWVLSQRYNHNRWGWKTRSSLYDIPSGGYGYRVSGTTAYRPQGRAGTRGFNYTGGTPTSRLNRSARDRLAMKPTFSDRWIGSASQGYLRRAGWNLNRAISGRAERWRRSYSIADRRLYRGDAAKYSISLAKDARVRAFGRAGDNLIAGLKHLPGRTKFAVPAAAIGVGGLYAFMKRRKKDKFYTHYYDF